MKRELFRFISWVDLPFLPGNTKSANGWASKLEPVATFMKHKCWIFVVVVFGRSGFKLLFNYLFFRVLFILRGGLHWEGWLEGSCSSVVLWAFCDVVVVIIVEFYELIQRFVFLFTGQLFFIEKSLNLAKAGSIWFLKSEDKTH